jgi:D-cysteine desulfhydrase family pyridoxal phosphate-dependent enzyme
MWIGSQPRVRLATLPTPLDEAPRLRQALGGTERCPRILLKRDDLTGLAFGGNKARKLEFLVGDAQQQGATVLVTTGAVQSNHARMTAAAARLAGMKAALVLTSDGERPEPQGNLLLDRILGAEIHCIRAGEDEAAEVDRVMNALRTRGERPYLIPVGGSSPVGALGYVAGTLELVGQLFARGEAPARLYYASGSRGTQAGLTLGAKVFSAPYELYGVAVSGGEPEKTERALRIANQAAALIDVSTRVTREDLRTDSGYIGPGYGIPTPGCLEAVELLARCEGVFLDPVYTGKAMAGLIDHVRRGLLKARDTVVFLHTGGTPALFAHTAHLIAAVQ